MSAPKLTDREMITFLWDLLDDIDTASDIARSNDGWYRNIVERLQQLRWNTGITSDGYVLTMPDGSQLPAIPKAVRLQLRGEDPRDD